MSDHEPHKKTCRSLKWGLWWGAYYNTIPLDRIKAQIEESFTSALKAYKSNKIDDALTAIKETVFALECVKREIKFQEQWNTQKAAEMAEEKIRIVADQTLRLERKNQKAKEGKTVNIESKDDLAFWTGDEIP